MPGSIPTIYNPTPPGGQLYASEAGLPQGSTPGAVTTQSSCVITISAPDGVGDLTVGGYRAISQGVFTPGAADLGYGRLAVTAYDPASGQVSVQFTLTSPVHSSPGGPMRYGDIFSQPIVLTDVDGDSATSNLLIDIRDDDLVQPHADEATATAGGGAVSGNLLTDGTPDQFSADGSAGVIRIGDARNQMLGVGDGSTTFHGQYGQLTVANSGAYTYVADAGAPAGVDDHFIYWIADRDGDQGQSSLTVHVQRPASGASGATPGDDNMTGSSLSGGQGDDTLTGTDGQDYLRGDEGNDRLVGGAAFDDLNGNMGNDTVYGGAGDDWVVGGKDQDQLFGDDGGDVVLGNLGDDTLDGGTGNDIVRGGQGNDVVMGGWGDDFVSGDRGDDTLTGGGGADTFHTFDAAGLDIVTDFNRAEGDRVYVLAGQSYSVSQQGGDVVIDVVGGGHMVLQHTQLSTLDPGWIYSG